MPTQELISMFIEYITIEKGYPQNTKFAYERDLKRFERFLSRNSVCHVNDLDSRTFCLYLTELSAQGLADSSRNRALAAIQSFYKFLRREDIIKSKVPDAFQAAKLWKRVPDILSVEEIKQLLSAPDIAVYEGARDRAVMELLYGGGLRVSELCSLRIGQLRGDFVHVKGKGGKERIVPVNRYFLAALEFYFRRFRRKSSLSPKNYVFISRSKTHNPIDRIMVWRMIKKYATQCGISKNISPHTFRHSYASHLLQNGADIRIIQDLLGHSSIESTNVYLQMPQKQVFHLFEKLHPLYNG